MSSERCRGALRLTAWSTGCSALIVLAGAHSGSAQTNSNRDASVVDAQAAQEVQPRRKPTLLPAAKRRRRSSTPPPLTREQAAPARQLHRGHAPAPLPPARDVPGDRGPPLGVPGHLDPRLSPAAPQIGAPPLPPARQVPGETGIPLGPGSLSPVR